MTTLNCPVMSLEGEKKEKKKEEWKGKTLKEKTEKKHSMVGTHLTHVTAERT